MSLKISIVIPSFNQGKYIEETILSVLNQKDPNLELIVIDGNSTDNSVEIIRKYESALKYWISESDSGQSDAINKGYSIASGEIITWLGSDDLLLPGSLARVRMEFESAPSDVGVIFGQSDLFRDGITLNIEYGSRIQNVERRLAGMAFPQPSSFTLKKFVDQVGIVNPELHFGMDYELFARLALVCDFKRVDYCFSRYRIHDESKSGAGFIDFSEEWIKVFNSIAVGLKLESTLKEMAELDLITDLIPATRDFFDSHRPRISIDEKMLSFFFISNVFFHMYLTGRFKKAKNVADYLNCHYREQMQLIPDINLIFKRSLKYPPAFLGFARSLKQYLTGR